MGKRWLVYVLAGLVAIGFALAQDVGTDPDAAGEDDPGGLIFAPEDSGQLTILGLLHRGGPLMYPLYLASFVMVAFSIERGLSLQRRKVLPPGVVGRIRDVTSRAHGPLDVQKLLGEIASSQSPIVRVVKAGLRKAYRPTAEIEKAIEDAGAREAAAMRRNCRVLSVIASVAPLLGLLGTVVGMIKAFMTVAAREEALGRTELLAAGIYQALVTTATGLTIAIPALVLYYLFVDKIERLVNEMDNITIELVERMPAVEREAKEP